MRWYTSISLLGISWNKAGTSSLSRSEYSIYYQTTGVQEGSIWHYLICNTFRLSTLGTKLLNFTNQDLVLIIKRTKNGTSIQIPS